MFNIEDKSSTGSDTLLWSLQEAARQLGGVSTRSVRRMIDAGELPAVSVRRSIKIPVAAVLEWVERNMSYTHNHPCAGPSVLKEKSTCHRSVKTETRTVSTGVRTRHTGGPVTVTQAAKELAAVLELPAAKKPR